MSIIITHETADSEYIRRVIATNKIIQLAVPNQQRLYGLIRNLADTDLYIRYGDKGRLKAGDPYIRIPAHGGNTDIGLFTGAIYGIWAGKPKGIAVLHHYYKK
jgi:hypothetical protein